MKNADKNRFISYFVDYVIKNDKRVLIFRKKNRLPNRISLEESRKNVHIAKILKKAIDFIEEYLSDYVFLNNNNAKEILAFYLFSDIETTLDLAQSTRNLGNYLLVNNLIENKIKDIKNRQNQKNKNPNNEGLIQSSMYPVSLEISLLATKSSLRKFIEQNWKKIDEMIVDAISQNFYFPGEMTDSKYQKVHSRTYATNYARLILLENEDSGVTTKELKEIIKDRTGRKIEIEEIRNMLVQIRKHKGK